MIDLSVERALRQLAQDAEIGREELVRTIVRDWLFEHRCFEGTPALSARLPPPSGQKMSAF